MTVELVIAELKKHYNKKNIEGMERFGINVEKAFGLNAPTIKSIARKIGKNHELALQLWESGYHEARQVAFLIDDPKLVTKSQMNKWVRDFQSWDICDGACCYLFEKTDHAIEKIFEWAEKKDEYVRRAAFSLIAYAAVHQKTRDDNDFLAFFPLIKKYSTDERNFVKKSVNWSLRQIGKRSIFLNKKALQLAEEITKIDSKSARWIAKDAIRELRNPKIQARIKH
jgi:3-methyladenine DNA glycosylase AlkD